MEFGKFGEYGRCCVISDTAKIGENVSIGPFTFIEDDVEIGANTKIGSNVFLGKGTKIGQHCNIDHYVRSSGKNHIGNRVTIRYGATIARMVTIRDNCFISPNVMTIYTTHTGKVMSGTVIGPKAFIGTAAVINGGVIVGPLVTIGAMSFVSRNCIEPGIYVGIPARLRKNHLDDDIDVCDPSWR